MDSLIEKIGKLVEQQEKMAEIFKENSSDIEDLKLKLDEKEQKLLT